MGGTAGWLGPRSPWTPDELPVDVRWGGCFEKRRAAVSTAALDWATHFAEERSGHPGMAALSQDDGLEALNDGWAAAQGRDGL